jgi:hypothetical protein
MNARSFSSQILSDTLLMLVDDTGFFAICMRKHCNFNYFRFLLVLLVPQQCGIETVKNDYFIHHSDIGPLPFLTLTSVLYSEAHCNDDICSVCELSQYISAYPCGTMSCIFT